MTTPTNPNVGRSLALMVTRRCNIACGHCSVESSPAIKDPGPSEQQLLDVLRQAAAAGVQAIQFTGGEPMLRETLVLRLMRETRRLGMQPTLTTNGFWGRTPQLALSRLKVLLKAGLARLTVSFDRHHAACQGPEPAVNIVRAGGRLGIPVNINITRLRDEAGLEAIVAPFANLPAAQLRFYDVQPVGAAQRTVDADAWRGETSGFCSACDSPAVTDDGRLIACNGPAYFTPVGHPLRLGSLREQTLADLLAAHRDDPLLDTIRTLGPERLRQELTTIPGCEALAADDRYRGLCDLCLRITSDPAAVSALRERLSDSSHAAERQAMALLIAHQRQKGVLNRQIVNAGGAARSFHELLSRGATERETLSSQVLGRSDLDWMQQADVLLASGLARPLLPLLDNPAVLRWAPAFFAGRVRQAALRDGLRELVQIDALERIDRALVALGGRGVLLKGTALLARRSGVAVLRAAGDIDVLVDARLAAALRQRLLGDGCAGDPGADRSAEHHLAGISWRGVLIEIHTGIMPSFWGLPEQPMLARVQPAPGYAALDTLDPEGMVLHAIVHTTTHLFGHGQKVGWDVEHLLASAGRPIDWQRLRHWVEACRVPRAFWVPCRVLVQELGLPLAPELLAAAPSDRRQRQLETIARHRLFTTVEDQFSTNPLSRTAVFLLLHDGLRSRLSYLRFLASPAASAARCAAGQRASAQRLSALPGHLRQSLRQLRQLLLSQAYH